MGKFRVALLRCSPIGTLMYAEVEKEADDKNAAAAAVKSDLTTNPSAISWQSAPMGISTPDGQVHIHKVVDEDAAAAKQAGGTDAASDPSAPAAMPAMINGRIIPRHSITELGGQMPTKMAAGALPLKGIPDNQPGPNTDKNSAEVVEHPQNGQTAYVPGVTGKPNPGVRPAQGMQISQADADVLDANADKEHANRSKTALDMPRSGEGEKGGAPAHHV